MFFFCIICIGASGHPQVSVSVPINIITTGGQTFAVASNIQGGIPTHLTSSNQMHIRQIAPNAATVVGQLQANNIAAQQIREFILDYSSVHNC